VATVREGRFRIKFHNERDWCENRCRHFVKRLLDSVVAAVVVVESGFIRTVTDPACLPWDRTPCWSGTNLGKVLLSRHEVPGCWCSSDRGGDVVKDVTVETANSCSTANTIKRQRIQDFIMMNT
jgi:hypothetical protein